MPSDHALAFSTVELLKAKEIVNGLLERLGLAEYLFEIVPRDNHFELRLDCALTQGWQSTRLSIDRKVLFDAPTDGGSREALLREWHEHFRDCKRGIE